MVPNNFWREKVMDSIFSMNGKCVVATGGSGMLMTPTIAEMLRLGGKGCSGGYSAASVREPAG